MKPKTLVTRWLPADVLARLKTVSDVTMWPEADQPATRDFLYREIAQVDAVLSMLTDQMDETLMSHGDHLRIIANMAVGYDNIDLQAAKQRAIHVTTTPDVLNETTADLTFALLLAVARKIPESSEFLRSGQWQSWSPFLLAGQDVYGATLGLIGMGRIGEGVARRARGFGMKLIYHNRQRKTETEVDLGVSYETLDGVLQLSDYVVVLTPLTQETHHLIGERELQLMKKTAILINVSRGPVVDEVALYRALHQGQLYGAGLDVFEQEPIALSHPLLTLPNVVALPHIGSASMATRRKMAQLAADNIYEVLIGNSPLTPIV